MTTPTVVVGAVIVDSLARPTRVLAARRRDVSVDAGGWEFPGGKVEPGETPDAALARELHEELGVSASIGAEVEPSRGGWVIVDSMTLRLFLAEVGGVPEPGPAHDDVRWLRLDELDSVVWTPVDQAALQSVRAQLSG